MALFGQAERDTLPLLTQFYQVEVPCYIPSKQYNRATKKFFGQLQASELFAFLSRTPGADFYGFVPLPSQLAWYADLHKAVAALMDALADDTEIKGDTLIFLERCLNQKLNPRYSVFARKGSSEFLQEDDLVQARSVQLIVHIPKSALFEELVELLKNPENKVKRCSECTSAYIVNRQGQVYCSDRCSARERQRRWYKKIKSDDASNAETKHKSVM
jgi:hypothetical protein